MYTSPFSYMNFQCWCCLYFFKMGENYHIFLCRSAPSPPLLLQKKFQVNFHATLYCLNTFKYFIFSNSMKGKSGVFTYVQTEVWTEDMCENNDHYLPWLWLWVGLVDKKAVWLSDEMVDVLQIIKIPYLLSFCELQRNKVNILLHILQIYRSE